MKRVLFLSLIATFLFATQVVNAQVKTKVRIVERGRADTNVVIRSGDTVIYVKDKFDADSVNVSWRKFNVQVGQNGVLVTKNDSTKKRLVTRVLLMDIGFAGFLSDGSLNMPGELEAFDLRSGRSRNVNLQLFTQRVLFAKKHMNFSYGLMFEFNKYRFQNDVRFIEGSNPLAWEMLDKELRKNKLKAAYLYVPIMFGVESNPKKLTKSFRARAGIYAGILTSSKQKLIGSIGDREKNRDDFNLNKFRYGIRGEMGYGLVNFYVHYSFASMFKEGQGPDLQPINFGMMLLPF